jgi:hypothetical protein
MVAQKETIRLALEAVERNNKELMSHKCASSRGVSRDGLIRQNKKIRRKLLEMHQSL